jgi:hypothetical protein
MSKFWETFWPYQFWRFVVINARMYLIARGLLGSKHG